MSNIDSWSICAGEQIYQMHNHDDGGDDVDEDEDYEEDEDDDDLGCSASSGSSSLRASSYGEDRMIQDFMTQVSI